MPIRRAHAMFWLWLFLFGLAIGVVSGLQGIGGGILLVPGLILLFGFSQAEAQGTSLAVLIPPIGLFAAAVYYQHGFIRLPVVGFIAVGFMIGAFCGAWLVPHLSPHHLRLAFGVFLLYLGFIFVWNPGETRTHVALPAGVATVVATLFARWRRCRTAAKSPLPQPGDRDDYHI